MKDLTLAIVHDQPLQPCSCGQVYDPVLDNITSVLSDICQALDASKAVRFVVGGFGQERWPVDVRTDLAVVVEQVPGVIDAVTVGTAATLDFVEQGIQRTLRIDPAGAATVRVECESMTPWRPLPPVLIVARVDLVATLTTLLQQFMKSARQRCPALAAHPWVSQWLGKYEKVGAVEDKGLYRE